MKVVLQHEGRTDGHEITVGRTKCHQQDQGCKVKIDAVGAGPARLLTPSRYHLRLPVANMMPTLNAISSRARCASIALLKRRSSAALEMHFAGNPYGQWTKRGRR